MDRHFISFTVSKIEFAMILSALRDMAHHYEDHLYEELAKDLETNE